MIVDELKANSEELMAPPMGIQINVYRTIFRTINQRLPPLKGDTGGCCRHHRQIDVYRTVCRTSIDSVGRDHWARRLRSSGQVAK